MHHSYMYIYTIDTAFPYTCKVIPIEFPLDKLFTTL